MDTLKWLAMLLVLPSGVWAQAITPPCLSVTWEYDATARLGSFFVYVSAQSGIYPIAPTGPMDSRPRLIVDANPMTLQVSCAALKITGPGPWYLVMTAVSVDMLEESDPSEEKTLDGVTPLPLPPLPPSRPPPIVTLPPPLPWAPRPNVPPLPPVAGDGTRLTETDVWRGMGATPLPTRRTDVPGAPLLPLGRDRLTETPTWRGQR